MTYGGSRGYVEFQLRFHKVCATCGATERDAAPVLDALLRMIS